MAVESIIEIEAIERSGVLCPAGVEVGLRGELRIMQTSGDIGVLAHGVLAFVDDRQRDTASKIAVARHKRARGVVRDRSGRKATIFGLDDAAGMRGGLWSPLALRDGAPPSFGRTIPCAESDLVRIGRRAGGRPMWRAASARERLPERTPGL